MSKLVSIKSLAKTKLTKILLKLLQESNVKDWLDTHRPLQLSSPNELKNSQAPYADILAHKNKQQTNIPIFITSRFRSGSTLLWNLFRQNGQCTSYYEPFNERQWFNPATRGQIVDQTHRGVDDYWQEFSQLAHLTSYYSEDWIRHRLLMTERCWDSQMKTFIDEMIHAAPNRAVMQFNRIDFRLPWLQRNYPSAKFVHLYRHPRDQWCSFITNHETMTAATIQDTYVDNFYLNSWCDDLQSHFPFLNRKVTPHPYQRFYYLWKLSYLYGRNYCDISISFEQLTSEPAETITRLYHQVGIPVDDISKELSLISPPPKQRWKQFANEQWFHQLEQQCERTLDIWLNAVDRNK